MNAPPLDVAAATRITASNRFNISDVAFVGLQATHLGTAEARGQMVLDWEIPPVTAIWDLSADGLRVVLPMTLFIDAYPENAPTERTRVAEISVVMRIDYRAREVESDGWEQDLPHYVGICGYLHAWPYLRSEVQWLTAKLGFPPLVLPVVVSGEAAKKVTVRRTNELQGEVEPAAKKASIGKQAPKKVTKEAPKKLAKKKAPKKA